MTNRSKQKGTAAETAVVDYLNAHGFPNAERRALAGSADRGDIGGVSSTVIEVKNCATMQLGEWVHEADVERLNALALIGAVWHKRRGKSSPGEWYVTMTGHDFVFLLARWLKK